MEQIMNITTNLRAIDTIKSEVLSEVAKLHCELADFEDIGRWICGAKRYFLQPFAESDDILDKSGEFKVDGKFVDDALHVVQRYVPAAAIRGK